MDQRKSKASPKIQVAVENLQKRIPLNLPRIAAVAQTILHREGLREAQVSIVFVSSQKIRALNQQYLKRSYVTDVLAFDLSENKSGLTGDIAICADMAARNAKIYQTTLSREIVLYVAHGLLHLLGFDDHSPKDIRAMRKKEEKVLGYLGKRMDTVIDK